MVPRMRVVPRRLHVGLLGGVAVLAAMALLVGHTAHIGTPISKGENADAEIQRLRGSGQYRSALELARGRARTLAREPRTAAWTQADATRLVATLERIVALPDSDQQALAEADGADPMILSCLANAEYRRGVTLAEKQLATRRRLLGENHPDVAASLWALGELRLWQGDYDAASDLHTRALAMRRTVLGEKHPAVAQSLESLGRALRLVGRGQEIWQQAEACLRQSLDLRRELFGQEHTSVASSLNGLGDYFRARARYREAIPMLQEALRMRTKLLGTRHPDVAETLCNLGLTYYYSGDWKAAAPSFEKASDLARRVPGVTKETRALSLSLDGLILYKQGRYREAEQMQREAAEDYEALRLQSDPHRPAHQLAIYTQLAMTQILLGKDEEAWESLDKALNRSLLDELVPPPANSLASPATPPRAQTDTRFCSLSRVQAVLPEHAALIGWLEFYKDMNHVSYPLWGYVIRSTGPVRWVRVDAPPGSSDPDNSRAVADLYHTLSGDAVWPILTPTNPELVDGAKAVYQERLAALAPFLEGVNRLIVIRASTMACIPLDALIDEAGDYVGERYAVSYTPSASLFVWMREHRRPVQEPRTWSALAVGDPAFGPAEAKPDRGSGSATPPRADLAVRETHPSLSPDLQARVLSRSPGALESVSPLPASREEVRKIAEIFPATTVLVGSEASKREITRLAVGKRLGNYDLIHFATHALIETTQPMNSAILLAKTTPPPAGSGARLPPADDGLLTPSDILSTWALKADLVTLSACQTGSIFRMTLEPSLGLDDALFQSGAQSLLVSMWEVDDRATALLMGRFYENLTGFSLEHPADHLRHAMPKDVALQEAKQWLRRYPDSKGGRPFQNPAFWAPFVLIGDAGE
jgi:CHAT domain-containing protein/tetratricopeptide (TPR) repeat protein